MTALTRYADLAKPHALGLFRVVIGFLFACHGASSIFGVLGGAMGSGAAVDTGAWPGWYAAVIQLVCGVLVLTGPGAFALGRLARARGTAEPARETATP